MRSERHSAVIVSTGATPGEAPSNSISEMAAGSTMGSPNRRSMVVRGSTAVISMVSSSSDTARGSWITPGEVGSIGTLTVPSASVRLSSVTGEKSPSRLCDAERRCRRRTRQGEAVTGRLAERCDPARGRVAVEGGCSTSGRHAREVAVVADVLAEERREHVAVGSLIEAERRCPRRRRRIEQVRTGAASPARDRRATGRSDRCAGG